MILLEIPPNPNCEAVEQRIFNDVEPPMPVTQVRLEREPGLPHWYAVTGWTLHNTPCPATACKVDDSGEGVVFLISGGEAGLRLQPADDRAGTIPAGEEVSPVAGLATQPSPWRLEDLHQWGHPFLLIADPRDLQLFR